MMADIARLSGEERKRFCSLIPIENIDAILRYLAHQNDEAGGYAQEYCPDSEEPSYEPEVWNHASDNVGCNHIFHHVARVAEWLSGRPNNYSVPRSKEEQEAYYQKRKCVAELRALVDKDDEDDLILLREPEQPKNNTGAE